VPVLGRLFCHKVRDNSGGARVHALDVPHALTVAAPERLNVNSWKLIVRTGSEY
jgi:hypothetical protein